MDPPTFITSNIDTDNLAPASNLEEQTIKRKRLTQACDACRKKKVKCSGDKPSCNNCTRLGQTEFINYFPQTQQVEQQQSQQEETSNEDRSSEEEEGERIFFGNSSAKPGFHYQRDLFVHCDRDPPIKSEPSENNDHSSPSE